MQAARQFEDLCGNHRITNQGMSCFSGHQIIAAAPEAVKETHLVVTARNLH
jgi:hypothetical protein